EIHNFKAIHHLEISLAPWQDSVVESETGKSDALSTDGNWRMLLGENASGKSTVLSAIAMALMGKDHLPDPRDKTSCLAHEFKPERILRRKARSGFVRIRLSHEPEDFFMRFTKNRIRYEGPARDFTMFLRAYGAVRLLPGPGSKVQSKDEDKSEQAIKIVNLFDPFQPLVDAEQWLQGLDEKQFGAAALAIKDLLNREEGEILTRTGDKVRLDGDPLDDISDGYRSVVAMACDIMAGHPHSLHDMQQATGIVLIDEIGAHLHPQWRMWVVARFRTAFRGIQFIVTTHEPLCLRGLRAGEVCLMEREKSGYRRVSLRTDLPSPEHMRVDQLLTSSIFGMESTIDPALDAQFAAYYRLLAKPRPNAEERVKLEAYRKDLKGVGVLGYTRRDQMVYEII
ncbi:MAG: ATP-binding protein, partial [bacterium]|nr:ATP-binding protein [bacterium]